MKITEVVSRSSLLINEAKARLDHPEDVMFNKLASKTGKVDKEISDEIVKREGRVGALRALSAIEHAVKDHSSTTTIKWDGSPAVIFGWLDKNNFVVTDKSGIGATKYNGRPTSANDLTAMIYGRKPDQPGRAEYAANFGSVYNLLKNITPKNTAGKLFKGDMLWMSPGDLKISDGVVAFQPNKIRYAFDLNQKIGQQIKSSQAGVVIHGVYASVTVAADPNSEAEPTTPTANNIKSSSNLMVFGPETEIPATAKLKVSKAEIESLRNLIKSPAAEEIDQMLDPTTLRTAGISNFPDLFKDFINFKASRGQGITGNTTAEFINWIKSPQSKITAKKQQNVIAYVQKYKNAVDVAWKIVAGMSAIKNDIKAQFDKLTGGAEHEGYVSVTPHGQIKFVNRPVFMKKEG